MKARRGAGGNTIAYKCFIIKQSEVNEETWNSFARVREHSVNKYIIETLKEKMKVCHQMLKKV